jgi:hypothetical protein
MFGLDSIGAAIVGLFSSGPPEWATALSASPQTEPAPTVCLSCGAVKNENGELPCDH